MRLAHLESSLHWGGQELRVVEQIEWLNSHGFEAWLIARPHSEIYRRAENKALPCLPVDFRGTVNPRVLSRLIDLVRRHRFDLLDAHSTRDASYACWVKVFTGIPVVRSRHVIDPIKTSGLHRLIWRYGNHHIVVTADRIKQELIRKNLARADKIHVAAAGVDEKRFDYRLRRADIKQALGIPPNHRVVANIGMIRRDKGQLFFVRAIDDICDHFAEVTFLQVGEATISSEEYQAQVLNQVDQLRHGDRIQFIGYREDIENYLAIADLIVIASIGTEARTRLVSQAMLMKKAVVATTTGGLPEMIIDGKTGLLCEPESSQAIAEAVVSLLRNPGSRESIAEQAFAYARKYLTFRQMMDGLLAVYDSVVAIRDG